MKAFYLSILCLAGSTALSTMHAWYTDDQLMDTADHKSTVVPYLYSQPPFEFRQHVRTLIALWQPHKQVRRSIWQSMSSQESWQTLPVVALYPLEESRIEVDIYWDGTQDRTEDGKNTECALT